jgi:hypothetical protein
VSYAVASYGLVIVAVLAYAVRLARLRSRLAAELRTRSGSNRG